MKTQQHTPGPWKLDSALVNVTDSSLERYIIANCHGDSVANLEANARLIAAAPELLEALELHVAFLASLNEGWLGKCVGDIGLLNNAYIVGAKAIAKAKGSQR